jgi:CBS domain-containing protein
MDGAVPEPLAHIAKDLFPGCPSLPQATDWLLEEHLGLMLDLTPYMSRCAHTLHCDASMARAHHLFVSAGLRSLPILCRGHLVGTNEVVGIITRADLLDVRYEEGLHRARERERHQGSQTMGVNGRYGQSLLAEEERRKQAPAAVEVGTLPVDRQKQTSFDLARGVTMVVEKPAAGPTSPKLTGFEFLNSNAAAEGGGIAGEPELVVEASPRSRPAGAGRAPRR